MKYARFEDLPSFVQEYVKEIVPGDADRAEWVRRRVPALEGGTFLDLCNEKGIVAAAKYLTDVGTKYGIPHTLKIPANFKDSYDAEKTLSHRAVSKAQEILRGRSVHWESQGISHVLEVASIFCYGAVEIDPKYLTIWVILCGPSERIVPEWYTIDKFPKDEAKTLALDPQVVSFFKDLRSEILGLLKEEGWTYADPFVGFESGQRVSDGGGWHYFK